eukprot:GHVS01041328.1.p1 GENE.GHVS01041328.1~~GHVS01041328.1.p1  ORF type:complete len:927 (-),score=152.05 GHVS01041328.1:240-3020(-)
MKRKTEEEGGEKELESVYPKTYCNGKRRKTSKRSVGSTSLPVPVMSSEERSSATLGTVVLVRAPIMHCLHVDTGRGLLFQSFRSPLAGHTPGETDQAKQKTLGCRIGRVANWISAVGLKGRTEEEGKDGEVLQPSAAGGGGVPAEDLVLWTDETGERSITVDSKLCSFLREHQRQGVKFIFECLAGLREFGGCGCILADDMGLGKTLQSIAVMWTLLKQGFYPNKPLVRRAVVVCPASLVKNWADEVTKWLGGRCVCTVVAESNREKVASMFAGFRYDRNSLVLISSYETFRGHAEKLEGVPIDLVICDEAHRLKNDRTRTSAVISSLPATRRLLLSGTPIQNDLDEFYALVSLCNPNVLGGAVNFRKVYASPILIGREPGATEAQQSKAADRLSELSTITNQFIIRRTNTLLAKLLPPKYIMNIFCRLSPLQRRLYDAFLQSGSCLKMLKDAAGISGQMTGRVLSGIQGLMKLCNHPSLIVSNDNTPIKGFEGCESLLSEIGQQPQQSRDRTVRVDLSGKCHFLACLLQEIQAVGDRVVLISNYTQTLDLFEKLCRQMGYPAVRLDGATSITKRHTLVKSFNDLASKCFAFLLSSKAGGCGINLIGANRLVLFDPDWNPANDKQALARIWREGQRKICYIYRLFSTGTIEEKIYQRQICKDGLSTMLVSEGENQLKDSLSSDLVKNLFGIHKDTDCDTHELLRCRRCPREGTSRVAEQLSDGQFDENDLLSWLHLSIPPNSNNNVVVTHGDASLCSTIAATGAVVSFVMSCCISPPDNPDDKQQHNDTTAGGGAAGKSHEGDNAPKGMSAVGRDSLEVPGGADGRVVGAPPHNMSNNTARRECSSARCSGRSSGVCSVAVIPPTTAASRAADKRTTAKNLKDKENREQTGNETNEEEDEFPVDDGYTSEFSVEGEEAPSSSSDSN